MMTKRMRFIYVVVTFCFLHVSCTQKDEQFCDCMKTSKSLDAIGRKLVLRPTDKKLADQFKTLKVQKSSACKPYLQMTGEEMLKRKAACKDL